MLLHRYFLVLGSSYTDLTDFVGRGIKLSKFNYTLSAGIDSKGKATDITYRGEIDITLPQLPSADIAKWALGSHPYQDGTIVVVDDSNRPVHKVAFSGGECFKFELQLGESLDSQIAARLIIDAESLLIDDEIVSQRIA